MPPGVNTRDQHFGFRLAQGENAPTFTHAKRAVARQLIEGTPEWAQWCDRAGFKERQRRGDEQAEPEGIP